MAIRTLARNADGTPLRVAEKTALQYGATLLKQDGTALGSADVSTLTLTVYDLGTGTIINAINAVSILNTGRGTLSASGALLVTLDLLDLALVNALLAEERHCALIQAVYAAGLRAFRHEVEYVVANLQKVS